MKIARRPPLKLVRKNWARYALPNWFINRRIRRSTLSLAHRKHAFGFMKKDGKSYNALERLTLIPRKAPLALKPLNMKILPNTVWRSSLKKLENRAPKEKNMQHRTETLRTLALTHNLLGTTHPYLQIEEEGLQFPLLSSNMEHYRAPPKINN